VSYDAAGTVGWVNEAFKQTLHLPNLKHPGAAIPAAGSVQKPSSRAVPGQ
jgi:hypothetical protein